MPAETAAAGARAAVPADKSRRYASNWMARTLCRRPLLLDRGCSLDVCAGLNVTDRRQRCTRITISLAFAPEEHQARKPVSPD